MAMRKEDIEEKLILAKSAAYAAIQNGDFEKLVSIKAEMHALNILLHRKTPANPLAGKPRGRKPEKLNEIAEKMRHDRLRGVKLENLKEEALAERYGASRDTCRRARDKVLNGIVGK